MYIHFFSFSYFSPPHSICSYCSEWGKSHWVSFLISVDWWVIHFNGKTILTQTLTCIIHWSFMHYQADSCIYFSMVQSQWEERYHWHPRTNHNNTLITFYFSRGRLHHTKMDTPMYILSHKFLFDVTVIQLHQEMQSTSFPLELGAFL